MSRSPDGSQADRSAVQGYQDSWEAIYNLIDEGMSWSGNERNCAFLNVGGGRFANVSAVSGLDFPDDGRALAVADWDFDGRVDFWVTNRTAPRVRFLRNMGGSTDRFVSFRLRGTTCNRDAIGARLELSAGSGRPQIRTLHAGDGYLAQSSRWIHFGLGESGAVDGLAVRWPGGDRELFGGIEAGKFYEVVEGSGRVVAWRPPLDSPVEFAEGPLALPSQPATARTWVAGRVLFPVETYRAWDGETASLSAFQGRPLLVNLWSATCLPCLAELHEWRDATDALREAGLQVLALCVDESPSAGAVAELPFASGIATDELVQGLETVSRALLESRKPLPVPCSVLLDRDGLVAALYKGPVAAAQLRSDVALLDASPEEQRAAAVPFAGRWASGPLAPLPRQVIGTFMKAGDTEAARAYTQRCLAPDPPLDLPPPVRASLTLFLGDLHLDAGQLDEAVAVYGRLFELASNDADVHREVGIRLVTKQRARDAIPHLARAVELNPEHVDVRLNLASLQLREGLLAEAAAQFRVLAQQRPDSAPVRLYLATALHRQGMMPEALDHYRAAHRLQPGSPATNTLAWILATHPDDAIRNGAEAVTIAEAACQAVAPPDPNLLNTLAAAYAETGRFAEAARVAGQALALAKGAPSDPALLARITSTLESAQAGKAVRD